MPGSQRSNRSSRGKELTAMPERDLIIDQFLGDASTSVEWANDEEKKLHFWHDDLHCPQPISPMWLFPTTILG